MKKFFSTIKEKWLTPQQYTTTPKYIIYYGRYPVYYKSKSARNRAWNKLYTSLIKGTSKERSRSNYENHVWRIDINEKHEVYHYN